MQNNTINIRILVTSQNPVKIEAAKKGFIIMSNLLKKKHNHNILPNLDVIGIKVDSGVSDQPSTNQETLNGALNRTQNCLELTGNKQYDLDYIVSQEGGIEHFEKHTESFAWVVVYDVKRKAIGKAKTASFLLPPKVVELLKQGYELGTADDMVFGKSNSKQNMGSIGLLSDGAILRLDFYAQAVALALIPILQTKLY